MSRVPVYVGLDYHSGSVQVCVMDGSGRMLANRRCGNSVAEVAGAVSGLGAPARVAVEACCGAADLAEELASQAGWPVSLAHPGYVARMKHNPDKSDFSDARMLAELCRLGAIAEVWLAPSAVRQLRATVRYRFDQVRRGAAVKMRILAVLREERIVQPAGTRWTKRWLSWLRGEPALSSAGRWIVDRHLSELDVIASSVRAAELRLEQETAGDAVVARLRGAGVGPVTSWTLRAMIGRFDRFRNGKQLARFCALTPRNASSGQRQADAGLIRAGDPALRTVLIQAAHSLRRFHPRWRGLYERLRDSGKPACVATIAVANRWVRALHHQMVAA